MDWLEKIMVEDLTEDQEAALALFAQPIAGWSSIEYLCDEPPGDGLGPDGPHLRQYRCPIILWRHERRMIRPNGDILKCTPANDAGSARR